LKRKNEKQYTARDYVKKHTFIELRAGDHLSTWDAHTKVPYQALKWAYPKNLGRKDRNPNRDFSMKLELVRCMQNECC
jgi:hypothetical protein